MAGSNHRRNLRGAAPLRRLIAGASFLVLAAVAAAPASGTDKLTCGKPARAGKIKVTLVLQHGADFFNRAKTVDVDSTWDAETKAGFIRAAFWSDVGLRDTVKAMGTTAKIEFVPAAFWKVVSVAVSAPGGEDTNEPDEVSLGLPPNEQEALCSLGGAASGVDAQGAPAFVRVWRGATNVTLPLQPGMPSLVVEQMLISRLVQAGVPARFAVPADFDGGSASLAHDGRVIWFPVADSTGFGQEISDTGLHLDLAAVIDGIPDLPSAAPVPVARADLFLQVRPSVFSSGEVTVSYVARGSEQLGVQSIDLSVFDAGGRRVRRLLDGHLSDFGSVAWDGRDDRDAPVPGGVYFARLRTPVGTLSRRIVRVGG